MRKALAFVGALAAPAAASACGGLFCDANQPVTQAAERILFAPGEAPGTLQMHVQLTYAGPPEAFGWLLPTPPDVEFGLSNDALFQRLDALYAPQFRLTIESDCDAVGGNFADAGAFGGEGGAGGGGGNEGPDVQVLSRQAVGPFDQVTLAAQDASELLRWLEENEYNAPEGSEEILQEYLDNGSVFVALKLLPAAGVDEISPVRLQFTANQPVVPIKPTQLAAEPDMGMIVHVLGDARTVPTNYLHVSINERAIDWFNFGSNYADVVSQAADEAGGQAFTTDFAGPITDQARSQLRFTIFGAGELEQIRNAQRFGELFFVIDTITDDIIIALSDVIDPPEGLTVRDLFDRWWQFEDLAIDGNAIAAALADEVNPPREQLNSMFTSSTYISRLYTTLSAAEMQADPMFDQNVDFVDAVQNIRQATFRTQGCNSDDGQLIFSDGSRMAIVDRTMTGLVQRQNGETVRGLETMAAALIERTHATGQPEVIEDREGTSMHTFPPVPAADDPDDDGGCGNCAAQGDAPLAPALLFGLGLGALALRRRRR